MEYADGRPIKVGDQVELWPGCRGVVVMSVEDNEALPPYDGGDLSWLGSGIMIDTDCAGWIHISTQELVEDLKRLESNE